MNSAKRSISVEAFLQQASILNMPSRVMDIASPIAESSSALLIMRCAAICGKALRTVKLGYFSNMSLWKKRF
jgi:hypothetical protein